MQRFVSLGPGRPAEWAGVLRNSRICLCAKYIGLTRNQNEAGGSYGLLNAKSMFKITFFMTFISINFQQKEVLSHC